MSDEERDAVEVYRDWKQAQGHLKEAPPGSAEAGRLLDEMERLRREYVAIVAELRRGGGPPTE